MAHNIHTDKAFQANKVNDSPPIDTKMQSKLNRSWCSTHHIIRFWWMNIKNEWRVASIFACYMHAIYICNEYGNCVRLYHVLQLIKCLHFCFMFVFLCVLVFVRKHVSNRVFCLFVYLFDFQLFFVPDCRQTHWLHLSGIFKLDSIEQTTGSSFSTMKWSNSGGFIYSKVFEFWLCLKGFVFINEHIYFEKKGTKWNVLRLRDIGSCIQFSQINKTTNENILIALFHATRFVCRCRFCVS